MYGWGVLNGRLKPPRATKKRTSYIQRLILVSLCYSARGAFDLTGREILKRNKGGGGGRGRPKVGIVGARSARALSPVSFDYNHRLSRGPLFGGPGAHHTLYTQSTRPKGRNIRERKEKKERRENIAGPLQKFVCVCARARARAENRHTRSEESDTLKPSLYGGS